MSDEEKLNLEVVSPEKLVFSQSVDMVTVSGTEGDFGVLPGHAPIVSSIRPGILEIDSNKEIQKMFISGGFIEVLLDKVSILATEVFSSEDINVSECENKINEYNAKIGASKTELDKESMQKSIDKYQAMIEFKDIN